jgi:hypothetical protein
MNAQRANSRRTDDEQLKNSVRTMNEQPMFVILSCYFSRQELICTVERPQAPPCPRRARAARPHFRGQGALRPASLARRPARGVWPGRPPAWASPRWPGRTAVSAALRRLGTRVSNHHARRSNPPAYPSGPGWTGPRRGFASHRAAALSGATPDRAAAAAPAA